MPAPILPLTDAVTHWPARGALIGLDLGTKTIGVAVSDPDRKLATGVETIKRKQIPETTGYFNTSTPDALNKDYPYPKWRIDQ